MRALLVGYGKMGRAIEVVLVQRGHTIAGRFGRGENCLEGKEGKGDLWGASASIALQGLTAGVHLLKAVYAGDNAHAGTTLILSQTIH